MAISRWATPKRYECAHRACPEAALILVRRELHEFHDRKASLTDKAHNCCGTH